MDLKILDDVTGKLVYSLTVEASISSDTLQRFTLPPGNYRWSLGDHSKKRTFTILKR